MLPFPPHWQSPALLHRCPIAGIRSPQRALLRRCLPKIKTSPRVSGAARASAAGNAPAGGSHHGGPATRCHSHRTSSHAHAGGAPSAGEPVLSGARPPSEVTGKGLNEQLWPHKITWRVYLTPPPLFGPCPTAMPPSCRARIQALTVFAGF